MPRGVNVTRSTRLAIAPSMMSTWFPDAGFRRARLNLRAALL
jgi:hypothetical protein